MNAGALRYEAPLPQYEFAEGLLQGGGAPVMSLRDSDRVYYGGNPFSFRRKAAALPLGGKLSAQAD